ncbi:MAG: methionyl-tRNA formyltransferase [Gammaproteobacteria bacterium]
MNSRILFAGSPAFATPTLEHLATIGCRPIAVLTQPDRPAGRGRKLSAGPVKQCAMALGIPVLQPQRLKDEGIQSTLRELAPDLIVVVAYGLLLPPAVLAIPRLGCINVHASLLPRWRGASPIQAAILAGDPETGVSIMQLEAGLDTGPVYSTATLAIGARETAGELESRLAQLGAEALGRIFRSLLAGELSPAPQSEVGVTYAGRIQKADARIQWQQPAQMIVRRIRAFNPWPVAETTLDGQQLRCFAGIPAGAETPTATRPYGQIVAAGAEGIEVQTGAGRLCLQQVQLPGRQKVAAADLARGRPLLGKVLGAGDSGL